MRDRGGRRGELNLLLTCAGRRNYLVEYFRQALEGRGATLACDASPDASALHEADRAFVVPPVDAPDYLDVLVDLCRAQRVALLLSLNDLELPLLARHRDRFLAAGALPVVSSPAVVDLCFDKWATFQVLRRLGVGVPRTFVTLESARAALASGELAFPVVVKPRWGSASVAIEHAASDEELAAFHRAARLRLEQTALWSASSHAPDRSLLVQERLRGQEHGLDVVNDLRGRYVATFVKRKLAMRAGETDRAVTVADARLEAIGRRLARALRHVGNLDCDVFVDGEDCRVLELNPRFGGGYPFSHAAGANLPAALVAWARGAEPDPAWLRVRPGVASAKCDRLVAIRDGASRAAAVSAGPPAPAAAASADGAAG